jgi:hypothetical protein
VSRITEGEFWGAKFKTKASEDIKKEVHKSATENYESPAKREGPTKNEIERSKKVELITELSGIEVVREQARELAREYENIRASMPSGDSRTRKMEVVVAKEYENIRASMPSGDSRTRKMEVVVAKMRTVGQAIYSDRYRLSQSASPGDRLQAISSMQVQPDYDLLDWLGQRVKEEKPFVAYHALVALNVAASGAFATHYKDALRSVASQLESVSGTFQRDADRRAMFERFKEKLATL